MDTKFKLKLENWTKVSIETAKLLLEESNDYVAYTVGLADKITQRAYAFSVVLIAAIGGLIGKLLTVKLSTSLDSALFWLLSISIFVLFFISLLNVKLIFPFTLVPKGRKPQKVGEDKFLSPSHLNKEQAFLNFVLCEIEENQNKIDYNKKANQKRLGLLKALIFSLLISFPAFSICYILIFTLCQ